MTPEKKEHLSTEELKELAVQKLQQLAQDYLEFGEDIAELIFFIQNDNLANNQAFLLVIGNQILSIPKDTPNKNTVYENIITFCETTQKKLSPVATETSSISNLIDIISKNPLVHKENLRYRDIAAILIALKNIFPENETFGESIVKLRGLIHKRKLGKSEFSMSFEGIDLSIEKNMGDGKMLIELFHFAHKIYGKYPGKFQEYLERSRKIKEDEPKDRLEIWSVILATLSNFKTVFHGSPFGAEIAELRDTIQTYNLLGNKKTIQSPWGISLEIEAEDELDTLVEKLIVFLAEVQEKNAPRFPKHMRIRSQEVIANKEKEKIYWRDILAGLDFIQTSKYTPEEYPQLEQLREMVEDGQLGAGLLISLEVDEVKLYVTKFDSEKRMKNKILQFIGELKFRASQGEDMNAQKIFWQDILLQLKGMEEAYGDYADYQLLMMTIESKTLGTVKDFSTVIDGILLEIFPIDNDKKIREKLAAFIRELKENKKVKIDENAMRRMKERLEQTQREQEELRRKYDSLLYDQDELKKRTSSKMQQQEKKIKELKDDLEREKQVRSYTPSRSSNG